LQVSSNKEVVGAQNLKGAVKEVSIRTFIGDAVRSVLGRRLYLRLRAGSLPEHSYLRRVRGVIHIGANEGQERDLYAALGMNVIWIEPIPEVFRVLKHNISEFPKQRAFNYLVMDENGKEYEFHISNHAGASSSILDFSKLREMWPDITYTNTVKVTGFTLRRILELEHLDLGGFDALVLDTQGSEHKILLGATDLLANFKFIKVEVPDFESYKGCCKIDELSSFMFTNGFHEQARFPFMSVPNVGTYFDVLYKQVDR
jgi:FkbM family methyltransferase